MRLLLLDNVLELDHLVGVLEMDWQMLVLEALRGRIQHVQQKAIATFWLNVMRILHPLEGVPKVIAWDLAEDALDSLEQEDFVKFALMSMQQMVRRLALRGSQEPTLDV
jgi:hypothetical protein